MKRTGLAVCATVFAVMSLSVATTDAEAQSFNCARASTPDEQAICQNSYLAGLDEQMSRLYSELRAYMSVPRKDALRNTQIAWLNSRKRCGYNEDCIAGHYNNRIAALRSSLAQYR